MENKKSALAQFFGYYFRGKKEQTGKGDYNLKAMHVINKISITVFLLALGWYIYKHV